MSSFHRFVAVCIVLFWIAAMEEVGLGLEIHTETPTVIPTPTPSQPVYTPTTTPTLGPTPILDISYYTVSRLFDNLQSTKNIFAVHPRTGQLFLCQDTDLCAYSVPASQTDIQTVFPIWTYPDILTTVMNNLYKIAVGEDGTGYGMSYASPHIITTDLQKNIIWYTYPYDIIHDVRSDIDGPRNLAILSVTQKANIPGTKVGDILVLFRNFGDKSLVLSLNPNTGESSVVLNWDRAPAVARDFVVGPDGALFIVTARFHLYRLEAINRCSEFLPAFNGLAMYEPTAIEYLSADRAFYVYHQGQINRIADDGSQINRITSLPQTPCEGELGASPDGRTLYIAQDRNHTIYTIHYSGPDHSTGGPPTPETPTSTPTPVPAWYMVDGFGGIHSSNPKAQLPVLPYFAPFDIVRDIEPDPQGRGWYMLDGFGGIHTSSPDLPKPVDFPYFGFDIARDLEVKPTETGYRFYMLDGYGVIHTDDPFFQYGYLPWFGADRARGLESDPSGEGWLVMDESGVIYSSTKPIVDSSLCCSFFWYCSSMRKFIRFPDQTTVMLDFWGGRHTDPFYPAWDLGNGFPPDLYFPGWDIIWDLEVVPESLITQ